MTVSTALSPQLALVTNFIIMLVISMQVGNSDVSPNTEQYSNKE